MDGIHRMDDERKQALEDLIRSLGTGGSCHKAAVDAMRGADAELLAELARHASGLVRCAVTEALRGRAEPELLAAVTLLASDESDDVRRAVARAISQAPDWPVEDAAVARLLRDHQSGAREDALRAAGGRPALVAQLCEILKDADDWEARQAAGNALGEAEPTQAFAALLLALAHDEDDDVKRTCATMIEKHLERLGEDAAALDLPPPEVLRTAQGVLDRVTFARFGELTGFLASHTLADVDPAKLRKFGTDLSAEAEGGRLSRAYYVDSAVDAALKVLMGDGARSVVLFGESGVGKTAIVHELVHRLADDEEGPWRIVRVSPSEMLSGTSYIGEWQTKTRALVQATARPKRVILYVPNLDELAEAGKSSASDLSIATMLAPDIESGRIALVGETTPESWSRGLGRNPSLRRLFARIDVSPARHETTRQILELIAAESALEISGEFLDSVFDLADFYMAGTELPGRAAGLLRLTLAARAGHDGPLSQHHVLAVLHAATGIPVDFLDDGVPLRVEEIRAFFDGRVMGQPDATDRVLDLVTLVKAGLTNPLRPYGVLLFVGPTGVGKTELARSLAEFLFGDANRLLRFDMSEFASYEAFERLIGTRGKPGLLTGAVRDRPFSVILLDEIEKAHTNVFDLLLQVFDAGRLTDADGRTSSFRNTILIMTSNLGARTELGAGIGFDDAPPPPADRADVERELSRFFRPEFLGRIDDVVHFNPLSEETADSIARREVARVLQRSGIARRRISVDIDPGVYALLLRQGYSPAFGARPLKRTVESLLLLPLARSIAEGRVEPGAHMTLVERAGTVQVEVERQTDAGESRAERESADMETVRRRIDDLRARAIPVESRRSALLERSNAPDFWERRNEALLALDELHRLDRLLDDLRKLEFNLDITAHNPNQRRAARFLATQDLEAARLERLLGTDDLSDAFITLTRLKSDAGGIGGVERLARMYCHYAKRHHMHWEVLDDRDGGDPPEDSITIALAGPGAHALFAAEAGLHKLRRRQSHAHTAARDLVRVDVLRAPALETPLASNELRTEVRALEARSGRLIGQLRNSIRIIHLPTKTALLAWTDRDRTEALTLLTPLLRARIDQGAGPYTVPETVRTYEFGAAPLVRDRRTGRKTGKLDRVMGGELELVNEGP